MASDRSLFSASPSSRAPHESPCLATAGSGCSCTTQRLLPIRSARPRERFSDLLTMIDGKSMATLSYERCLPFDLRARLLAQQSSLLVELESCFIQGASKLVPDGGDGRAAGVSTDPTAADLPSRVRRSPALYAVQPLPPGVWPSRTPPGWLSSRVGRPRAASPTTLSNAALDAHGDCRQRPCRRPRRPSQAATLCMWSYSELASTDLLSGAPVMAIGATRHCHPAPPGSGGGVPHRIYVEIKWDS